MNPSPEFLGIQLENSILCKHRKIAGRVETIFCEAAPIRLNEIARLKRLGPEPIAYDRCPECRQYVCSCLWKKHVRVRSNEKLNAENYKNTAGGGLPRDKCRPKVNVTPFKVRKWNSNYGSTFSTQMSWLKKPIHKMSFSDDEQEESDRQSQRTFVAKSATEHKAAAAFQNVNCNLQTPGKIDNSEYIQVRKDYFEKSRKTIAEKKSNQNIIKSVKKSKVSQSAPPKVIKQNQMVNPPQPAAAPKHIKDVKDYSTPKHDLPMQLNKMMAAAPLQIPPKSPEAMLKNVEVRCDSKMTNYVHRVTELLQSRSMFGNQAQCCCHPSVVSSPRMSRLTKMSDAFNYPSRFNLMKSDGKDCGHKASDFLFKYKEAGVSRPACTVESLENMEKKVKKPRPLKSSTKTNTDKYNAFYGDARLLQQAMLQRIDSSAASGSNTATATATTRSKCDRGEKKKCLTKHIAVQTEESSFSIPTLYKAQMSSNYDLAATDAAANAQSSNINVITLQVTAVESSLLRMEQDFGEALVQELVCELTDEVAKCNSRVKKLTALFESRNKIHSSIHSSQSLSFLNDHHHHNYCGKDINLNVENAKSFCSAAEFSKRIKHQTQKQSDGSSSSSSGSSEVVTIAAPKVLPQTFDDANNDDDYDSSFCSSKSYSEISITTVVVNPLKEDIKKSKSKEFDVFESYELELP